VFVFAVVDDIHLKSWHNIDLTRLFSFRSVFGFSFNFLRLRLLCFICLLRFVKASFLKKVGAFSSYTFEKSSIEVNIDRAAGVCLNRLTILRLKHMVFNVRWVF